MFDIKWIRSHSDIFDAALSRRGLPPASAEILGLDSAYRQVLTDIQDLQAARNIASKQIGDAKRAGQDVKALQDRVSEIKAQIRQLEKRQADIEPELKTALSILPNMPLSDVPDGIDETDNVEMRRVGVPRAFDFIPKQHFELGERLSIALEDQVQTVSSRSIVRALDFEVAARLSGSRFVVASGLIARLERALGQLMLDIQTTENGYTEMNVPYMVREAALFGTSQLPKFAEDLFHTDSDHYLIPTAEVPLTNLVAGQIIPDHLLPLRFTALSPCFRSEAGASGRDTRGMLRQHQFHKVEMVSVTTPEQSEQELDRMTRCAEDILQRLELPYRVMTLCTGDMGFGARKTYDLEVWMPGQDTYREISSCSLCGDFQARRMMARCRPEGGRDTRFVHTLNGSGLAVGRALIAILENGQNADGSVTLPDVLLPYMNGIKVLPAAGE